MLLVPGFAQTVASWDDVIASLRRQHPAIAAPRALEIPQVASFAATADALADIGGPGLWCGYSMGGRLALQVAIAHPHVVHHLVLVSATAGLANEIERQHRIESDDALAQSALADGAEIFLDRWIAQPMFAGVPAHEAGTQERRSLSASRLSRDLRILGTGAMPSLWDNLRELTMPVTIVTGSLDSKFTAIGKAIHAAIADSVLVTVDCGHSIPLERPDELAAILHDTHSAAARNSEETI